VSDERKNQGCLFQITNFLAADSDFPLASLRARVASARPWCVPCSLHASPTLGVGGVWWGYHALTLASPVAVDTLTVLCGKSNLVSKPPLRMVTFAQVSSCGEAYTRQPSWTIGVPNFAQRLVAENG